MAEAETAAATGETAANIAEIQVPENKMRMRIARKIGLSDWQTGFRAENPDASKDDEKAAWDVARKDFTKVGMRAVKALERTGYQVIRKDDA